MSAVGIASACFLSAAPVVACRKPAKLGSIAYSDGVRLHLTTTGRPGRRLRAPGFSPRASVFDDAKKAAGDAQAEAGKAASDASAGVKKGVTDAQNEAGKIGKDVEGKVGDVKSGVDAQSAETKEKVGGAVDDLKGKVEDAIDSQKS